MKAEVVRAFADLFGKKGAVRQDSPTQPGKELRMLHSIEEPPVDQHRPSPDLGFAKRLRWKIQAAEAQPETLMITPAMADAMLAWNDRNRPASKARIKNYVAQMKSGHWAYTRVPLIFSKERLIDGQHRLLACIESGVAFRADVVYGAPDDSFYYIDVGGTRTASDIFAINAVPNAATAAAMVRLLMGLQTGAVWGAAAGTTGGTVEKPSLQQVYQAYCDLPDIQESVKVANRLAGERMPMPSAAGAVHYLCARRSRKQADDYFDKIISGIGFTSRREPSLRVREFLIRPNERLTRRDVLSSLIQGWNATRTNKPLGTITTDKIGKVI